MITSYKNFSSLCYDDSKVAYILRAYGSKIYDSGNLAIGSDPSML